MAVLAYQLLKGTGRRVGEVASLHLDCLGVDEHAKAVLVYDNHKAARMGRRLPLADTRLVDAIRAQQSWVVHRFPNTARDKLWLLPRPTKNVNGTVHLSQHQIHDWMRVWIDHIPRIDAGGRDHRTLPTLDHRNSPGDERRGGLVASLHSCQGLTSSPSSSVTATGASQAGQQPPMPTRPMKGPQLSQRCSPRARAPQLSHS